MNSIEIGGSENIMHLTEQITYMCKCQAAVYSLQKISQYSRI